MSDQTDALAKLRAPFPDNQISKLPKESKAQADQRKADRNSAINCQVCGGWHHKNAVHLDYVGHAALTDRLLDTDPEWTWEPVAFGADGLPALDRSGGMWIRLTVCGVTRLGYGSADGKQGGDAVKEIIGDALRNAAMRFGAALDLWHKGDLHADDAAEEKAEAKSAVECVDPEKELMLEDKMREAGVDQVKFLARAGVKRARDLPAAKFPAAMKALSDILARKAAQASPQKAGEFADIGEDSIPY
ncbi:MAG TPA: hypothetical protein VJM09_04810 [Sphingobium sp.]|nr:hypothetical protein [Sphingobium sp.]